MSEYNYILEKAIFWENEHNRILKQKIAWEKECYHTKLCLFELLKEAAKEELNLGQQIDFVRIKEIADKYGFKLMYEEAIKKVEEDIP